MQDLIFCVYMNYKFSQNSQENLLSNFLYSSIITFPLKSHVLFNAEHKTWIYVAVCYPCCTLTSRHMTGIHSLFPFVLYLILLLKFFSLRYLVSFTFFDKIRAMKMSITWQDSSPQHNCKTSRLWGLDPDLSLSSYPTLS